MKSKTYHALKRPHLNLKSLRLAKEDESNPYDAFLIDMHLDPSAIPWDGQVFTQQFRLGVPRDRMDETVITFLLHVISVVYREKYTRSFVKPESFPVWLAWVWVLKYTTVCVLGLMYNVRWDFEKLQGADLFLAEILNSGKPETLRQFMRDLGIQVKGEPYQAEKTSSQMMLLHTGQFGPFYWRLLHWMAEAYRLRSDYSPEVKKTWRDFVTHNLYRFPSCPICQFHFQQIVNELKEEMLDAATDQPALWFKIHNKVNANRRAMYPSLVLPDYSESEYEEDSKFMRQALSQV